jgi:selenide, water dikinase
MEIKLTQYSHGAGCGCKIAPNDLERILSGISTSKSFPNLLVGNQSKDDAAVYDLGDGTAIISTTDFFMPIVDDPIAFGRIASVNAISDIYAMGGRPLMAVAILGWPMEKIDASVATMVLEGSKQVCAEAGIPLAGGHSIDCPEPVFGLAVTGRVAVKNIKRNDTAKEGCKLYLSKPLGSGLLSTLLKGNIIQSTQMEEAIRWMSTLNAIGEKLGEMNSVKAITDVTGFGLLGHLLEMCEGSKLSATIEYDNVPMMQGVKDFLFPFLVPQGCNRNWDSYKDKVSLSEENQRLILADPQTSGGLLIAAEASATAEMESLAAEMKVPLIPIGYLTSRQEKSIYVV